MKNNFLTLIGLLLLIIPFSFWAQSSKKVLIFSKTEGYRHKSIENGIKSIEKLGLENNFIVDKTENSDSLIVKLKSIDAVVFLSTTGDILNELQQKEFENFIKNGGGFVGIHAAADTEYDWPWYGEMVGAYFKSHPKKQEAKIKIINHNHPATKFLEETWNRYDEWYNYKNINAHIHVLMLLDESSYNGGENGEYHPIAWFQEYEGGKIFYTGLGHTSESYVDNKFLNHILGAIKYVLND